MYKRQVHYAEVFDRGVAFVQLGYETGRVRKLLDRYVAGTVSYTHLTLPTIYSV